MIKYPLSLLLAISTLAAKEKNPDFYKPLKLAPESLLVLSALDLKAPGFIPVAFRESIQAAAVVPIEERYFQDAGILITEQQFETFCRSHPFSQGTASALIPRLIHLIWLGSTPPPTVEIVIASWKKHHPILERCLELILTAEEAPELRLPVRSGPGLISKVCLEALDCGREDILILPCTYFYPFPYLKRLAPLSEIQACIRPESHAIHLWEASWFN